MTFARTLMEYLRNSAAQTEDAFGSRLARLDRNREARMPRFRIFRNLASRPAT